MNKENIIKSLFVFGGGFLLYMLVRSTKENYKSKEPRQNTQNFVSKTKPSQEDAKIVLSAYKMALKNNESAKRLSELNQECLKEFSMRCYVNDKGKTIVCDTDGETILTD